MAGTPLELIAVEVRADLDQLERGMPGAVRIVDQSMARIDASVKGAEQRIAKSSGQVANTTRNLGRQVADIGLGLASPGVSPFLILAQQAPQVADAMSDLEGRAGKVAGFFAGPWGAAILAGVSVLGLLAEAALDSANAEDVHAQSAKSLADAINDMSEATKGAISTSQQNEAQQYREAVALGVKAMKAREATVALLQSKKGQLEADLAGAVGGRAANFGGNYQVQNTERGITRLNAALAEQNKLIVQQNENVKRAKIPILQREAAEATDAATAATGRYDRAVGKLNERFTKRQINGVQYRAELEALNRTRDAEVDAAGKSERATRGDGDAKRDAAKKTRELAAAQRELEQALDRVVGKYDPARKAAEDFRDTLADIDRLVSAGRIGGGDAMIYKIKAAAEQAKAVADAARKELNDTLGYTLGGADDPIEGLFKANMDRIDREGQQQFEASQRALENEGRVREAQIRTAATLYEDLFRGGTGAIWEDFKDIGLKVIASVLAQFTISQLGGGAGGGFNLGGALSTAIGGIFGFAQGGSMQIAGRGGTDRNTLSLNGRPIANVSRGETLSVASKALRGAAGGTTVMQTFVLDNRGGITTPELIEQMNQTAKFYATRAGEAAYTGAVRDAPLMSAKRQRFGN